MNLDRFQRERGDGWRQLDELLRAAGRRPERLGPDGVLRLGAAYRAAAADLALARRRWPGDPVVARLEDLVGRARHVVYDTERRSGSLLAFFSRGYWKLVRERPVLLAAAAAGMLVPAVLAFLWALADPGAAASSIPEEFGGAGRSEGGDLGLPVAQQAVLASSIFTNNIRVSFLAFAGGVIFGAGTAFVLVFNGMLLGVVGGLSTGAGRGDVLVELVVAHGVLELSVIVVAAAAGLRMGWSLVDPGPGRRGTALVAEARAAVAVVVGTIPWFVLAGLVEGFITPAGWGLAANTVLGVALGAVYWALVVIRGASPPVAVPVEGIPFAAVLDAAGTQSRARALALR
jgi:uncharacterized membrane protein SpoIIM required for sporulation